MRVCQFRHSPVGSAYYNDESGIGKGLRKCLKSPPARSPGAREKSRSPCFGEQQVGTIGLKISSTRSGYYSASRSTTGSVNEKTLPRSGSLSTSIVVPMFCASRRASASPVPVPE